MLAESTTVSDAAYNVGYESITQFLQGNIKNYFILPQQKT